MQAFLNSKTMSGVLDKNKGIEIGGITGGVILLLIVAIVVIFLLSRHRSVRKIPKFIFEYFFIHSYKSKKLSVNGPWISWSNYQNIFQRKETNEQRRNTVNSPRPGSESDVYEIPVSVAPPYSGKSLQWNEFIRSLNFAICDEVNRFCSH